MPSLTYWLTTAAESALSLFGIRAPYEQPAWTPLDHLPNQVEIRAYAPRTAAETSIEQGRDDQAFTRLFRYITGANQPPGGAAQAIAMTIPVERSPLDTLRFFLPKAVAEAGPPHPPTRSSTSSTCPPKPSPPAASPVAPRAVKPPARTRSFAPPSSAARGTRSAPPPVSVMTRPSPRPLSGGTRSW